MAVVNPDVVLISSDDEDAINFVTAAVIPEVVLISSDDDGGERNLDEGLESEQEADYNESDDHESDKKVENDVGKSNEGEYLTNGDERCDRSGLFNQGGNDLHTLSLYECETYLRKLGMRVSGTKEECIQQIEEHERLKDGKGESIYPESSFSINCTGDACRGDVVLFKQNMYNSQRNIIERRTVAGRIIKESYSASTLHTFSVEVLWSKQSKKLSPLSILLVKGRNLYRFGTFRQPWKSEAERSKVLEEKHQRGKEARRKRKLSETEFVSGGNKGKKLRKTSHGVPSQSKHLTGPYKHKYVNKNTTAHNHVLFQNAELKSSTQLTHHSDPNCSMYSEHHLQEASLPSSYDRTLQLNYPLPCSFSGHSHHSNEQEGPNQALPQPPDHHQDSESPLHRSTYEKAKLRFPESSFSINCTGDARERDIVLFKLQIFSGRKNVKTTVAGRIVKARQCESRDKHRFLIKVLWTIPSTNKQRSTLLVRSRNLYKFGTFRQPWKNEAMRAKMFEEKPGRATRKQKLKKMDLALNKMKGAKCQKVSDNRPSRSKKTTKIAKRKSSKRKDASATPVKEKTKAGSKRKSVQLQKTKAKRSKQQTFQLHPNPNTDLNPSLSCNPNPNPVSSTTSNLNPSLHLDPNPHAHQNQNPNTRQKQSPNSTAPNLNSNSSTTSNPSSSPHLNPNQHPNPNRRQNLNPNICQNPKSNTRQNPNLNTRQNSNPSTRQNPNPNTRKNLNPNTRRHLHPNTHHNPNLNTRNNPNPNMHHNLHPNTHHNLHPNTYQIPNPHPNNYMPAHQLQESSSSLPNQPAVCFPPNQPPFGFPGYVGQWGPNHNLTHLPGYHYMTVLMLAALCYQQ